MPNTRLEARVIALNRAHAAVLRLHPILSAYFSPLIGKQILKQDGTLLKKYAKGLPALPSDTRHLRAWKDNSAYTLYWSVQACEIVSTNGCFYESATCQIGRITNGVLTELIPCPVLRTNYTAEEVIEKRRLFELAQDAARAAEHALSPFGIYDR